LYVLQNGEDFDSSNTLFFLIDKIKSGIAHNRMRDVKTQEVSTSCRNGKYEMKRAKSNRRRTNKIKTKRRAKLYRKEDFVLLIPHFYVGICVF
jgi:hypothetical protein